MFYQTARSRWGWMFIGLFALGCGPNAGEVDSAAARGKEIYLNVCIACHNADPTKEGAVGPALAGASRELLEARVIRGDYPPGYTPQRDSAAMPQFPYLADRLDELEAFLAQAAEG